MSLCLIGMQPSTLALSRPLSSWQQQRPSSNSSVIVLVAEKRDCLSLLPVMLSAVMNIQWVGRLKEVVLRIHFYCDGPHLKPFPHSKLLVHRLPPVVQVHDRVGEIQTRTHVCILYLTNIYTHTNPYMCVCTHWFLKYCEMWQRRKSWWADSI